MRLLGGVHALVLTGRASWDDIDAALEHEDLPRLAARPVQTNEVRRTWFLLPCFLEVARRTGADELDLIELGASAGFNLLWDRYRYTYEACTWGPADAPLELDGEERRPVPVELLTVRAHVRRRVGLDLDPVDVTTEEGALRLRSFVWPGQTGRMERLDQAIDAMRAERVELRRGDIAEALPGLLADRASDGLTVVFETAVLGYLGEERWARAREALAEAGRDGRLALIWTDRPAADVHPHWGLWLQTWPGGEPELLAHADFHGAWLEWL